MATIGSIAIALGLNTAQFRADLKRTRSSLRKFTRSFKRQFNSAGNAVKSILGPIASFKSALVGLVGVGGIGLLIKSSLDSIDAVGKMSKTYGIATRDIAAFTVASEIGGSSLETFAKAARQVSKNVFDFVIRDTGEAKDAFTQMGISVNDLKPIMNDNVALLGIIGDKLNDMPDGAIKTALAYKLLGGRAIELLPALAGGTEQFEKYRKEADLLGVSLSSDVVKGVEDANDSITRLGFLFKGLRDQTVAALAGALEEATTSFRNYLLELAKARGGVRNLGRDMAVSILGGVRNILGGFDTILTQYDKIVNRIKSGFTSDESIDTKAQRYYQERVDTLNILLSSISKVKVKTNELAILEERSIVSRDYFMKLLTESRQENNSVIQQSIGHIDALIKKTKEYNSANSGVTTPKAAPQDGGGLNNNTLKKSIEERLALLMESRRSETDQLKQSLSENLTTIREAAAKGLITDKQALDARIIEHKEFHKRINELNTESAERQRQAAEVYNATRTPVENYAKEIENLNLLLQTGAISQDTHTRAVKQAMEKIREDGFNVSKEWADAWTSAGNRFAAGIGDSVADALFKQQTFGEAMKDITRGVVRQLISSLVEIGVKQSVLFALGEKQKAASTASSVAANSTIAASAAPAAAGVSLASFGANAGPAIAGILATIAAVALISRGFQGGFAKGGNFKGGKAMLVGEKGPELLLPDRAGTIINNNNTKQILKDNFQGGFAKGGDFKAGRAMMVGEKGPELLISNPNAGQSIPRINSTTNVQNNKTVNNYEITVSPIFEVNPVNAAGFTEELARNRALIENMSTNAVRRAINERALRSPLG